MKAIYHVYANRGFIDRLAVSSELARVYLVIA